MVSMTVVAAALIASGWWLGEPAPAPAAGSDLQAGGQGYEATVIRWSVGPELPSPRDHHAVFLTESGDGAYLYVAGGNDYSAVFADVWRAAIAADGSVSAWDSLRPLPGARAGASVAVAPRALVMTGGKGPDRQNTTETLVATVDGDGDLGEWRVGPPLPAPRFHHTSLYARGMVYVIGGLETDVSADGVFGARLTPEGRLGPWAELTSLPEPRSHHASIVHADYIYVVSGQSGHPAREPAPLPNVIRAEIRPDSTLGDWREISRLPHNYATHSALAHGGYVYVLGGVEDNREFVDKVLRAQLDEAGGLGGWELVAEPLPAPRAHVHHTPVFRNRIYSVGGSNRRRVTGALHVGALEPS